MLEIVFESVQQKCLDKTWLYLTSKLWILSGKRIFTNQHCTHLRLMRYTSNPLDHDCSWLIINLTVRLLFLFCSIILITNHGICPDRQRGKMSSPDNSQLLDLHYFKHWVYRGNKFPSPSPLYELCIGLSDWKYHWILKEEVLET